MKKTAIALAAAATVPDFDFDCHAASAASWDWGFSSPLFRPTSTTAPVDSRHLSRRDSVRVGPFRWSGGFGLGRDHADRCSAQLSVLRFADRHLCDLRRRTEALPALEQAEANLPLGRSLGGCGSPARSSFRLSLASATGLHLQPWWRSTGR